MVHLPRIMLAAPASGSGKTMLTCGLLQALKNRGLEPASFKCGPDYIDPMFHSRVIGAKSRNLDPFFTDRETTRYLFSRTARSAGVSVLEGVMGIFDGLGGTTVQASSYDLASVTDTPVILIVNARGMSLSVIPMIKGYLDYQEQFGKKVIRGVILNQMTKMTYLMLKEKIEAETGIKLYGYVPRLTDCLIESRHLGLVLPHEVEDLKEKLQRLSSELEACLDMEGILELAHSAEDYEEEETFSDRISVLKRRYSAKRRNPSHINIEFAKTGQCEGVEELESGGKNCMNGLCKEQCRNEKEMPEDMHGQGSIPTADNMSPGGGVRIAVAMDEAFCFYYQDNLDLLTELGAELVCFSPIRDPKLPENISGLILGGGYPELYGKQLSENASMRKDIWEKITQGIPYLAECGGFMYLHETMEDMEGNVWPMCGVISGASYRTPKLARFGYISLSLNEKQEEVHDSEKCFLLPAEQTIRAHEFHYFDSTDAGEDFTAKKPVGKRGWNCIHATDHSIAGYPHLYYWSNPEVAGRFVEKVLAFSGMELRK